MHSGFNEIRSTYHSSFVSMYTGNVPITGQAMKEIRRVLVIWNQARLLTIRRLRESGEIDQGFLFGAFGIADAFYWPMLWVSRG